VPKLETLVMPTHEHLRQHEGVAQLGGELAERRIGYGRHDNSG